MFRDNFNHLSHHELNVEIEEYLIFSCYPLGDTLLSPLLCISFQHNIFHHLQRRTNQCRIISGCQACNKTASMVLWTEIQNTLHPVFLFWWSGMGRALLWLPPGSSTNQPETTEREWLTDYRLLHKQRISFFGMPKFQALLTFRR